MIYLYASDFTHNSYGIRCQYEFIRAINDNGIPAKILSHSNIKNNIPELYKNIYCNINFESIVFDTRNDIIIYPDVISGNPICAKNIVRWLMNKSGFFSGYPIQYGDRDAIFAYSKTIDNQLPQLFYTVDERMLFRKIRQEAHKDASTVSVYFGKTDKNNVMTRNDVLKKIVKNYKRINIITRCMPNNRIETLRKIANSDILVSYDPLTNLNYEANLLDVPTVLMNNSFGAADGNFNLYNYGTISDYRDIDKARSRVIFTYEKYCNWLDSQDEAITSSIKMIIDHFAHYDNNNEYRVSNTEKNRKQLENDINTLKCGFSRETLFNVDINNYNDIPKSTARILKISRYHSRVYRKGRRTLARIVGKLGLLDKWKEFRR